MTEPHVVDLRTPDGDGGDRPDASADERPGRWLAGLALLLVGGVVGWLLALPADDPAPDDRAGPVEPAPTVESAGTVPVASAPEAGSVAAAVAASSVSADEDTPVRSRSVEAGLEPLPGVTALGGPITLLPASGGGAAIRLAPDGRIALVVAEPSAGTAAPPGAFQGYPVGEVDAGVLFIPIDYALGAVAYWTPEAGVALPIPEAPYETSFLAADGDLGVFLSGGDVVIRDLERGENLVRTMADIDGAQVVHACLGPGGDAVALVTETGAVAIIEVDTGTVSARLDTSTSRFGLAWPTAGQLARLVTRGGDELVVVTDLATGVDHDVARLDASADWKLTTPGTGC